MPALDLETPRPSEMGVMIPITTKAPSPITKLPNESSQKSLEVFGAQSCWATSLSDVVARDLSSATSASCSGGVMILPIMTAIGHFEPGSTLCILKMPPPSTAL